MQVKSSVPTTLQVAADFSKLSDGTLVLYRPRIVRGPADESGSDFIGLPEDVKRQCLEMLAHDAKSYADDMDVMARVGVVK